MISDTKASKAIPTAKAATIIEIIVHGGRLHSVGTRKERGKVARFDVKNCIYVSCKCTHNYKASCQQNLHDYNMQYVCAIH